MLPLPIYYKKGRPPLDGAGTAGRPPAGAMPGGGGKAAPMGTPIVKLAPGEFDAETPLVSRVSGFCPFWPIGEKVHFLQ